MEKQKSFSIKRARFMVFTLTIGLTLLFLVFFSVWFIKLSPFPQETHFQLKSAASLPFAVQEKGNKSEAAAAGEVNGNLSFGAAYFSSIVVNDGVLPDARVLEFGNSSDFSVNPSGDVKEKDHTSSISDSVKTLGVTEKKMEMINGGVVCDVANGKWVFDESYHPLYSDVSCPFIDEGFSCQSNGRTDQEYLKWSWQPRDCSIPRFNATHMLELMRGKRLVFVGDSINRNQWESMLCLLMGAIKDQKKVYETRGRRITKGKGDYSFKFVDYKCMVEFYVTHFLVRESKVRMGRKRRQTLRIDAIDKGSSRWRGADILVFNTAHWWSHHKTRAGRYYYQEGDQVHGHLDVSTAYRRALMTWASWVDTNINPAKTRVFFRTSSPSHFNGGQWNSGGHCREASRPLREESYISSYSEKNVIVEEVIRGMRSPVTVLNVTGLSGYRIDGHPSVYGRRPTGGINSSSAGVQDCSHWCLPGVPDTWNQILYYYLQVATSSIA
ncbi:hypothetical protein DM860_011844 [Cuscuta australis]|uniref:Uncharacterized protein n=1 Tax=Cuscuta australis TaxID=267555 RepID=A0A328DCT7_9ASTE|nr:hypothetical protein DM860_011844 [Cuscuta australis]